MRPIYVKPGSQPVNNNTSLNNDLNTLNTHGEKLKATKQNIMYRQESRDLAILIWNDYIARPMNAGTPVNFSFENLYEAILKQLNKQPDHIIHHYDMQGVCFVCGQIDPNKKAPL